MLIRSQDKTCLTNMAQVTDIYCDESIKGTMQNITAELANGFTTNLGTYSTEQKAIKVLDMIEDAYKSCNHSSMMWNYAFVENKVFQMPQDEEVEV